MSINLRVAVDNQIFQRQSYGGISRYFAELESNFTRIDEISIKIFAPFHRNSYIHNSYNPRHVRFRLLNYTNRFGIGSSIDRLSSRTARGQISKFDPHIIHETFYSGKRDYLERIPRVITVYDMIRELEDPTSEKAKRKFSSIMAATSIITISESTRIDLLNLLPVDPRNVKTIHLAASDFFSLVGGNAVNSMRPYVLYVGQRSGYKNFLNFCKSFALCSSLRKDFDIHVFGGGPLDNLESQILREIGLTKNVVKIDGDDLQLRNQYMNARALVYPSIMEGFGIPLVEAMMSGCPVICSDRSSIPEIAGGAANYFDPTSIESMASVLESTLNDSEILKTMRENGLARSKNFSWMRTVEETRLVYRDTIQRAL